MNVFGFREKMYYLCLRIEERALDTRALSSFSSKNLTYKAYFTSDIEKNRSEIFLFLGVSVIFLGQIVAPVADIERWKVKRYLFSRGADLTSLGNYSGGYKAMYRILLEGVWLSDIGRMAEVRNVPHLA